MELRQKFRMVLQNLTFYNLFKLEFNRFIELLNIFTSIDLLNFQKFNSKIYLRKIKDSFKSWVIFS